MPTVFVVQNHLRYDPQRGELVPRYNISPAAAFGKLKFILTPRSTVQNPEETIAKMNVILRDFSDSDHLLLIGNPVLIGWATALAAAHNNGRVKLLIWSGKDRAYTSVESLLPVQHTGV